MPLPLPCPSAAMTDRYPKKIPSASKAKNARKIINILQIVGKILGVAVVVLTDSSNWTSVVFCQTKIQYVKSVRTYGTFFPFFVNINTFYVSTHIHDIIYQRVYLYLS